MPALASNHQGTLAFKDAFCLFGSNFSKLRFDGATLGVHVFQFGRKVTRFSEIVAHQQIECQLGIAHTSCRIQARNDGEAQARRRNGVIGEARFSQKCRNTRARVFVDHAHTGAYHGTILTAHRHKVGHRAQRCQIDKLTPEVGFAKTRTNCLHYFQRHTSARKDGAGIVVAFRIDHRHALGNQIGRLVMVGNDHIDATLFEDLHFILGGNAVVYRNHQIRIAGRRPIDSGFREAIALFETQRNEWGNARAAFTQTTRHDGGCRNAVKVEVAKHQNVFFIFNGSLDTIHRCFHVFYFIRIRPIPFKRGIQKLLSLFNRVEPTRHQRGGNKLRQIQFGCKARCRSRIGRSKIDARTHNNTY